MCSRVKVGGWFCRFYWLEMFFFFFSSIRRHTILVGDWSSDVCSSDLGAAFGFPPPLVVWSAALVGRPGWRHYLAFDGVRPIATAGMYIAGDAAWLGWAATVDDARGRGAQTALIVRRIADAAAAGCRHLVVETAEEKPDKPNPSTRNLRRLGFTELYLRPNYI